jgi:endo-1,3(4)-beta-glucanase
LDGSTGVAQLIEHADLYATGVDLGWDFPSKDIATLTFDYKVESMQSRGDGNSKSSSLLMLALPHHVDVLSQQHSKQYTVLSDESQFDLTYETIKGPMTAVVGTSWSFAEELTSVGFDHESTLKQAYGLSNATKCTIMDQVILDVKRVLPTMDENVYGYGKQVARLAQLVHIAKTLTAEESGFGDKYISAIQDAQLVLYKFLDAFLTGQIQDSLVYDSNFGGLVTKDGLDDYMNDFGNGWYNDHHFHYGYFLYASAVMGQWNETFVEDYGEYVDAMMYDVTAGGSGSSEEAHSKISFPLARHKAWFDGHSFASGLFPFASGKSMESSTESINCYYGAYLWSMVRGTTKLHLDHFNFARLLLATEIRGVQTYWHMHSNSTSSTKKWQTLYNPVLTKNLMIGNLGMMDATVSTWFGTSPIYVHMINFLPVTAITRELFTVDYVKEEFNQVIKQYYDSVEMAWKGYVICDLALLDPNKAFQDAPKLRSYELDQAISQSQVLYFASTMADFDDSNVTSTEDASSSGGSTADGDSAYCADNPGCSALGLTGLCCPPTSGGANLGCCSPLPATDSTSSSTIADTTETDGSDSSCSVHEACDAAGLTGACCPTSAGIRLSCCDA